MLNEWWWPNSRNLVRQMKWHADELSLAFLLGEVWGGVQWARWAHSAIVGEAKRRLQVCFQGKQQVPGTAAAKDVGQSKADQVESPIPPISRYTCITHYTIWLLTIYVCMYMCVCIADSCFHGVPSRPHHHPTFTAMSGGLRSPRSVKAPLSRLLVLLG